MVEEPKIRKYLLPGPFVEEKDLESVDKDSEGRNSELRIAIENQRQSWSRFS